MTRLNNDQRMTLQSYARDILAKEHGGGALLTLYTKVAKLAVEQQIKEFPAADMKTLSRYDLTRQASGQRFKLDNSDVFVVGYYFNKSTGKNRSDNGYDMEGFECVVEAPQIPHINRQVIQASDKLISGIRDYESKLKAFDDAHSQKLRSYFAFIAGCKTLEALLEVWPDAAAISGSLKLNLPSTVTNEVIAMITADSKQRLKN